MGRQTMFPFLCRSFLCVSASEESRGLRSCHVFMFSCWDAAGRSLLAVRAAGCRCDGFLFACPIITLKPRARKTSAVWQLPPFLSEYLCSLLSLFWRSSGSYRFGSTCPRSRARFCMCRLVSRRGIRLDCVYAREWEMQGIKLHTHFPFRYSGYQLQTFFF